MSSRMLAGCLRSVATAIAIATASVVHAATNYRGVPSAVMQREIPVSVTTPASYANDEDRLPVVYLLHGAGDDEKGWPTRTSVQEMADRYDVIFVSPSVGNSWYFDSPEDPRWQFETFVSSELVAWVDAHYATFARREGRALAGNSMGGHGAMYLAIRHPDVFSAAAPMSGGMDLRPFPDNWNIKDRIGTIQAHPERWATCSVVSLADRLTNGMLSISIDCGTSDFFLAVNRALHEKLTALGIGHAYAEYPGAHNWDYWRAALPRQMAFLDRHFQRALAPAPVQQGGTAARHAQKVEALRRERFDLLMIGDSITHTLDQFGGKYAGLTNIWNRHFAPRHAVNLAYSGARTENVRWNLEHGELENQSPKAAVLLIGTNDADDRHYPVVHSPYEILAGTRAIVDLIRERCPATKILVLRIFPRGGDAERGVSPPPFNSSERCIATVRRAGELSRQLADGQHVFWLDLGDGFLRPDGTINTDLMPDLLHPNEAGAESWAQAIAPMLDRLMAPPDGEVR